jgi:hypothetical protein
MKKLALVPLLVVALASCEDQPGPVALDAAGGPLASLTADPCPVDWMIVAGPLSVYAGTFTLHHQQFNISGGRKDFYDIAGWISCHTTMESTIFMTPDGRRTAYHNWWFFPEQVQEVNSFSVVGSTGPDGYYALALDVREEARFISAPPEPAFVGGTYEANAIEGYHWDGTPLDVESTSPWVCTASGTSPVTVAFVGAGTCSLYSRWGEPAQMFEVVLPWTATIETGENVTVQAINEDTSEPGTVMLTFENVTTEGSVSVTTETVIADSDPQPPSNFQLGDPPTYYNITVSEDLEFDGSVQVCITFTDEEVANIDEGELELLHWNGTEWEVLENQVITGNTICADTYSFSPFAIGQRLAEDKPGKRKAKGKR